MPKPTDDEIRAVYEEFDAANAAHDKALATAGNTIGVSMTDRLRYDLFADTTYARLKRATAAKFDLIARAREA